MKALKTLVIVGTLAATSLALAQTTAPQKEPSKPQQPAGAASGGQTSGAGTPVTTGAGGIAGLGVPATIAIVAGAILVVVAASDSGGGSNSTPSH